MGAISNKYTIDERLKEMPYDSDSILFTVKNSPIRETNQIEIQANLPAAVDPDIIIGQVSRWLDLQKHLGKDLRVYLWCSNGQVEKYVLGIVRNMEHLYVTILPTYLKGEFNYDE